MPKYQVTLRTITTDRVEADNPYQAAVLASARHGSDAEIVDVRPASGAAKQAAKSVKKPAKKRRLSPEARARLAQNLVKARAARAAKRNAASKKAPAKKKSAKKARKATKKRS